MSPDLPWYITAIVLGTNFAIAAAVWALAADGARRVALAPAERRRVRLGTGLFLGTWLGAALLLAPSPESLATRDPYYLTPLIPLFGTVPAALVALALWRAPAFRRSLATIPVPALIGVQLYRVIGAVFLVVLGLGLLPAHFALPAGWGDIAVGLAAPIVAFMLHRQAPGARALATGWVVFGLLDLAVAVGMGTGYLAPLLAPELGRVPPAGLMGTFPLTIVPLFAVPVSVLLHLLALAGLLRGAGLRAGLAARAAR